MRGQGSGRDLPIRLEQVSIFGGKVTILDRISVQIDAGIPTVLIGPNGSGKTTFLRAAMGLIAPSAGHISWGGREKSAPSHRGFVFQKPVMLRRSVAGNLSYAMRFSGARQARMSSRIDELLDLVGLGGLAERPAWRLSGGEQKRLALARALARDPELLLLDEPTASLDPAATKTIEDIISSIAASGIKVVMSTHDLGEAKRLAGDVILLHRGRIVERGSATDFFNLPKTSEGRTFIAGELLI
jgi:tungstate transport system ATP-binding protein